jgi:hypothetical protein
MTMRKGYGLFFGLLMGVSVFGMVEAAAVRPVEATFNLQGFDQGFRTGLLEAEILKYQHNDSEDPSIQAIYPIPDSEGQYGAISMAKRLTEYPLHFAMEKRVYSGLYHFITFYVRHGIDFMAMTDEYGKRILNLYFELLYRAKKLSSKRDLRSGLEMESIKDILILMARYANYDNGLVNYALTSLRDQKDPFTGEHVETWREVEGVIEANLRRRNVRFKASGAKSLEAPF